MRRIHLLVSFGLLLAEARPEAGYSYPQPHQALQLSQSQASSSFQQSLPQFNQQQQQLQYSGANQYNLPSLPAPPVSQASTNELYRQNLPQQLNLQSLYQPQQLTLSQSQASASSSAYQQQTSQPQLNQQSLSYQQQVAEPSRLPQLPLQQANFQQLVNFLPQGQQFGAHLDIPQLQIQQPQFLPHQSLVTKHVYVHVAPAEPPLPPPVVPLPLPPRKTYRIIFIKAPSQATQQRQVIHVPAAQQTEEKTLVYVLVDKPQQPEIVVPTPAPAQPSKPEVYFIKYKAQSSSSAAAPGPSADQPVVEDLKRDQGLQVSSGESTSSLFSGGLPQPSTKYGPPDYQEGNARH